MKSIVLIEDNDILARVAVEELTDQGYAVTRAADGEEGVALVRKEKPDLVLLDVVMPKMNTKDIPVVMLTVSAVEEDIEECLKLGAQDYIIKSQHAVEDICKKVKEYL
jgi:CheY-like chemotaxis protein